MFSHQNLFDKRKNSRETDQIEEDYLLILFYESLFSVFFPASHGHRSVVEAWTNPIPGALNPYSSSKIFFKGIFVL